MKVNALDLYRLGMAYTQSLLSYHVHGVPKLFSASFAVTNKCNLRCSYCECPLMKTDELNLEQIDTLFSRLKEMGVVRLGLFGGEPMVRKDIGEIVDLAKSKGFFVSFNTNLLLYERFKHKLTGVDYFFTSLDGPEEKHLLNRGDQDYGSILAAIEDISASGKKITVMYVVTEPDYDSANYVLEYAERVGADVHFQAECYDVEKAGRSADLDMNQQEMREFWEYLVERKKSGAAISSSLAYLKYVSKWDDYRLNSVYDKNSRCAAGHGFLFVESTGFAYPCVYVKGMPKVDGVDLLNEEWKGFQYELPCTKCTVGPFLEMNILFNTPHKSMMEAVTRAF